MVFFLSILSGWIRERLRSRRSKGKLGKLCLNLSCGQFGKRNDRVFLEEASSFTMIKDYSPLPWAVFFAWIGKNNGMKNIMALLPSKLMDNIFQNDDEHI